LKRHAHASIASSAIHQASTSPDSMTLSAR
jgi:hypothetical protein